MAKKSFDEIWNESQRKSFDEIWGESVQTEEEALKEIQSADNFFSLGKSVQTEEEALREIRKTSPFLNAQTPTLKAEEPKKDFDLGYIGEQAWKGLVGTGAGLVQAGANILDNPVQSLNYVADKLDNVLPSIPFVTEVHDKVSEYLTGKTAQQRAKEYDENSILDPLAKAGQKIAKELSQYAEQSAYNQEDMGIVPRVLGDTSRAVGGMVPTIAANAFAPGAGMAVLGTSVLGNSMQQALDEGASYDDALTYGIASAGVEYATEKLFGGVPFLGEGKVDDVLKQWFQTKLSQGKGKQVLKYIMDSVGEGAEELISEYVGEFLTDIYSEDKKDKDIIDRMMEVSDDAFYSFLIGSLSGGALGAPRAIIEARQNRNKANTETLNEEETNTQQPFVSPSETTQTDPMKAQIEAQAKTDAEKYVESISKNQSKSDYLEEGLKSDNVAVKMEAQRINEKKIRKLYADKVTTDKQIDDIVKTMNSLGISVKVLEDYIDFDALGASSSEGVELSKKAERGITRVVVHELKHQARTSGINDQLSQELRKLAEMDGIDLDKSRENIVRKYAEKNKPLDNTNVEEELDAYIAQEYLFTEHGIKGLVRSNLSLAEKVKQLIRSIRIKISGTEFEKQLLKAEQLYTKAINEVSKTQSFKSETERRNMFAGEKATQADLDSLEKAKLMERFQRDKETILQETGWVKKADGKWRFEIDDSKATFNFDVLKEKMFPTLKEVLNHPTLYKNYPHLADMEVYFSAEKSGINGSYNATFGSILLNRNLSNNVEQLKSTLLHEVQHAVQDYEGFQRGTNIDSALEDIEIERMYKPYKYSSIDGFEKDYAKYIKKVKETVDLLETAKNSEDWNKFSEAEKEVDKLRLEGDMKYGKNAYKEYKIAKREASSPVSYDEAYERYKNTLGEVEARDTSERREFDSDDRKIIPPETEGYVTKQRVNTSYAINANDDIRFAIGESMLERSKNPAVRARAQLEKRIRHTFLFNKKSNPLKMYDVTTRIEDEFERTGKISDELRRELFDTAYEETLKSSDVSYKELPEFRQMLQEDLNRAIYNYEDTLIKERELKKFAEENDIDVSEVRLNPTTGFLKNVKPQDLPDKIISYKKLKASLKSDLIGEVGHYAGGKTIDELIDKAAIEIVEDGFISSPTKFKIRQEMIENGYSINADAMNDNKELYDFIKSTKFNVPRNFGKEIQNYDRTRKLLKTSTTEGMAVDKVYKELRSKFGEFFPDDLTNPADQYQQIADVMAELEPTRLMLEDSEQYNAEIRQYLEDKFTDRLEDFKNQVLYRSQKDYYDRAARKQVAQDNALNQISDKISDKFFKDNKEIDELMKSENVIKGASIEDLTDIVMKIRDKGALSKTLAQNLDAMAHGDVVLRAKLSEVFEKPLREAKKTYVTNQKRVLNDVYKRIVTDLGIKMDSKESAAMMWYGEGRKQLNKTKGKVQSDKLEFKDYTLDDLKRDFPDSWENIVEADRIMRKYYDEYVERINESLAKIYTESSLREAVIERRTQIQKDIREAQQKLEVYKSQRTGEVGTPDVEARINAQRKRITDLSRQFNNVAEDVYRNKRLNKRSDYYHHFQEIGIAENIQQILEGDSANNISNALAGISENTKPKSKWQGFMQRRTDAARYEEDAIKGFLKYAPAAEYKIAFDPYVAQMRGIVQDIIKLSDEAEVNNAKAINWLTNYTNSLAGKTNPMDRWIANTESGRTVLQLLNKGNSRVKANAVMGNLNSAVSQVYNLPNGLAVLTDNGGAQASLDVAKGSADYSAYAAKKISGQDVSDNPINQSVFLAERYIDSTIDQFDERIIHKPAQAAAFLLTFGDQVVAEQLWFSAYEQGMRLGKHDPVAYADDLVARAVGGRGIGEVPLMQQSQVVKLIAPFQVEVNNAWQLMKQMGGSALKDKNKALGLLIMYGMTWLMNEINEALTGNRVGMDIFNAMQDAVANWDEEKNPVANTFNSAGRLVGEILSNVPMGAQIAQMVVSDEYDREKLFGEADPSRFNTGNIGINALMDPAVQLATGQNVDWQSLVTNFVTPYGGKQLNRFYKMAEDIGLIPRVDFNINDGLQVSQKSGAYNDKGQLKYQIDTSDPMNVLKGFVFGTYATKEGRESLDNEYSALSDKKTEIFEKAVESGANPNDFYRALREANVQKNLTDKNGKSINNSKAALNRQALESNGVYDTVEDLVTSKQATASDFGLNDKVFKWTQEEFNKFLKSLNR